jgi:hypothetical protein
VSEHDRRNDRNGELGADPDALTLLSRALDMARRRLRYRIGATVIVTATLAAALVLLRC